MLFGAGLSGYVQIADMLYSVYLLFGAGLRIKPMLQSSLKDAFQGRDHWVLDIYSLTLKKREKFPLRDLELLPRKELVLSEVKSLGDSARASSAGKESTEVVRILLKLFFVCLCVTLYREFCEISYLL